MTITSEAITNGDRLKCSYEDCTATAKSEMGMKAHITRAHSKTIDADEIFAKVAAATKILWPDPEEVYAKFELIAEWRKATIKVLSHG